MMENEPFQGRVGTCLKGKWTLRKLLGVGGMASVYLGEHSIGRRVAIKILHPEVAADPQLRARFEEEARAVNRFHHPGAVEIVDIDVTGDGVPFLVMELLEGSSLQGLLDQEQVPSFDRLLQLADELLDVLVAAHGAGIIHRDIKPDNLFVQQSGALKVLDFGIARVRTEGGPARAPTQTGTTIGTVAFMSPEQAVGRSDVDARTDLFAVGATMFRVLTGRHVHEGPNQFQLMMMAAMNPAPPLASVLPGVPAEVALVVDRALAFDRDQRYPDARTMQDDVRALRRRERPPYASALAGAALQGAAGAAGPTGVFPAPPASIHGVYPASPASHGFQPPSAGPPSGPLSHSQVMGPTSYGNPGAPPAPSSPTQVFGMPGPLSDPPGSPSGPAFSPSLPGPAPTPFAGPPAFSPQGLASPAFSPQDLVPPFSPQGLASPAVSALIPPVSRAGQHQRSKAPVYLLGLGALLALLVGAVFIGMSLQSNGEGSKGAGPEGAGAGAAGTGSPAATAATAAATAANPAGKATSPTMGNPPLINTQPTTAIAPTIALPGWGTVPSGNDNRPQDKSKGKKKGKGD